jgi:hypothetical protein
LISKNFSDFIDAKYRVLYDNERGENMKNPNIAKVLKEYRKQNHYSVEDVVFKLEEQNLPFATKTIYGWESGVSHS